MSKTCNRRINLIRRCWANSRENVRFAALLNPSLVSSDQAAFDHCSPPPAEVHEEFSTASMARTNRGTSGFPAKPRMSARPIIWGCSVAHRPSWFSNALKPPLARRKNDPFSSCLSIGLCHPLRVCRRAIRGRILGTYSFYLSFIVPRIHKPDSSD